ncbi:alpha/beta hydrolase [Bailinhaonella thermotolerans]|uniref:alpha/beta hydrolase n=1 Tax=Bailinhaonella thermotolerans TaxID=1070861 RepID=UPI00192A5B00|nr:alpha/beta hydrolase [Bailinhaonella thermotolerans]
MTSHDRKSPARPRFLAGALIALPVLAAVAPPAPDPGDAVRRERRVEVVGDAATADRVVVVVPGSDMTTRTFDRQLRDARALYGEALRQDPSARLAVVAWLGYTTPRAKSAEILTDAMAAPGADALRRYVRGFASSSRARIGLLCHSYGSVVCAKGLRGLPVTDVAFFGSPGTGVDTAADLGTTARVWAGRGTSDWIRLVPNVRLGGVGFGADPTSREYGAGVFDAGDAGHSGYFAPGSPALASLARIALGRTPEAAR